MEHARQVVRTVPKLGGPGALSRAANALEDLVGVTRIICNVDGEGKAGGVEDLPLRLSLNVVRSRTVVHVAHIELRLRFLSRHLRGRIGTRRAEPEGALSIGGGGGDEHDGKRRSGDMEGLHGFVRLERQLDTELV